jgi:hypothetical protein
MLAASTLKEVKAAFLAAFPDAARADSPHRAEPASRPPCARARMG